MTITLETDAEWDFQKARYQCSFGKCDTGRCNLLLTSANGDYKKCTIYTGLVALDQKIESQISGKYYNEH